MTSVTKVPGGNAVSRNLKELSAMSPLKKAAVYLTALLLAACGGGGSSTPEAPPSTSSSIPIVGVHIVAFGDSTQAAHGNPHVPSREARGDHFGHASIKAARLDRSHP